MQLFYYSCETVVAGVFISIMPAEEVLLNIHQDKVSLNAGWTVIAKS